MGAPAYTDNVTVLAPYAVIKGESYKTVNNLDLRVKVGANLKVAIACGGSTALTTNAALYAKIIRTINNDGANPMSFLWWSQNQIAIGKALINNAANYAAGVNSIAYDGAGGAAFAAENLLCLTGMVTIPVTSGAMTPNGGVEWINLSKGAATPAIFTTSTKYAHNDNEIITLGSAWDIWLPGGATYALIFDHLFDAAGDAMICAAYLQSFDTY
jgi:hypothetical protein